MTLQIGQLMKKAVPPADTRGSPGVHSLEPRKPSTTKAAGVLALLIAIFLILLVVEFGWETISPQRLQAVPAEVKVLQGGKASFRLAVTRRFSLVPVGRSSPQADPSLRCAFSTTSWAPTQENPTLSLEKVSRNGARPTERRPAFQPVISAKNSDSGSTPDSHKCSLALLAAT